MTIHTINDHRIDVPADMQVFAGQTGPGAYDFIAYKGHEIVTHEVDEEPELYTGPFTIFTKDHDDMVQSLAEARAYIDRRTT